MYFPFGMKVGFNYGFHICIQNETYYLHKWSYIVVVGWSKFIIINYRFFTPITMVYET
jgi:hypothetical protein